MPILWIMLVTAIVSITALLPYYALYVRRRDTAILVSHAAALATALAANAVLVPSAGLPGGAVATLLAFVVLLICQAVLLFRAGEPAVLGPVVGSIVSSGKSG